MTRVDFYILPQEEVAQRHLFACRLVEKAFRRGHSIYIHSDDDAQANAIDRLLWQFRDSSFIPHCILHPDRDGTAPLESVQIGYSARHAEQGPPLEASPDRLLINLSTGVPDCFSRFERVSEIVVQHPQIQQRTRDNYRFYRDRGYQLDTHDLRQ